ncbi:MAG: hypothetical protein MUC65_01470 [Pontiellaceae bacterium]|nr:hypothetical protein [Pontiellaceae bacterium]
MFFFSAVLFSGCAAITLITLPIEATGAALKTAGAAVKITGTAAKATGNVAVGTAKLAIPDGEEPPEPETK